MAQRQTDTKKWSKRWFHNLKPRQKLLWIYLCDHCDNAGVIDSDLEAPSYYIGEKLDEKDIDALGDKIIRIDGNKLLIKKFIAFHWGNLSSKSLVHQSVVKLISKHKIDGLFSKKYSDKEDDDVITDIPQQSTLKGRDAWKEKLKLPYNDETFFKTWEQWIAHRKRIRKPYKAFESEQSQLDWFTEKNYTVAEAIEIIKTSLRNEYQGLFEPKNNINGKSTRKAQSDAAAADYKRELANRLAGTSRKSES